MKPVVDLMHSGDFITSHEYYGKNGPDENWGWWCGRLLSCPFDKPWIVGEFGADFGVFGQWGGSWWDYPGSFAQKAERYMNEMALYERRILTEDPLHRVKAICGFTYDCTNDWQRFNWRGTEILDQLVKYRQWLSNEPPFSPVEALASVLRREAEAHDLLPINEGAALAKAGFGKGLWPTSQEFEVTHAGVTYVAQRFRRPRTSAVVVLYCVKGQWDKVLELVY